ncbi:SDR family NAD(P)-dependent oxidoreductase [Novosphingobium sp. FSY-8]|uniref:SDR family NAD(P)-dependent oxidoreductase n=1 Tax=Novosphingobium ovatum TaxID=1908523 RepID=A0ABW9XDU5_9SPHN|nr:SDR family NAD(P)-dependent oxidoreductase [Novosphingobium ovatum]NBC36718.1 SDR family NAD(P)-dependent oxidoreductase [Novosphingobium ovatum]
MQNFTGKVAFVTGGASGIGLGMVRAFLEEGMRVVVADYADAHLDGARAALQGVNAAHFIRVDVSDRAALRAAADEALATFGAVHVLCNNAGVGGGSNLDEDEFEAWDRALSINLGGVANGCKIFAPIIKAQGTGGHIVNTASMAGVVPLPGLGAYSTAKYAVRGLTESLRLSLAPHGIGVSCLYPGAVKTALVPIPDDNSTAPTGPEGDFIRALWDAMRVAMEPLDMGRRVVAAIRANAPHILTHGEFLDELIARNRAFEGAFASGDPVPEARVRFEATRRAAVDALLAMPALD